MSNQGKKVVSFQTTTHRKSVSLEVGGEVVIWDDNLNNPTLYRYDKDEDPAVVVPCVNLTKGDIPALIVALFKLLGDNNE